MQCTVWNLAHLEFCLVGDCFLLFLPWQNHIFHSLGEYLEHFPSILKQMVSTSGGFNSLHHIFQRIHGTYL